MSFKNYAIFRNRSFSISHFKERILLTAVAIEVFLKYCINSFAHKNKLDLTVDGIVYKLQKSDHLVTSCFVVIGHLCQS